MIALGILNTTCYIYSIPVDFDITPKQKPPRKTTGVHTLQELFLTIIEKSRPHVASEWLKESSMFFVEGRFKRYIQTQI